MTREFLLGAQQAGRRGRPERPEQSLRASAAPDRRGLGRIPEDGGSPQRTVSVKEGVAIGNDLERTLHATLPDPHWLSCAVEELKEGCSG